MCATRTLSHSQSSVGFSRPHVKRGIHLSHLGDVGSITSLVIIVLLGFILFKIYDLTFQDLVNGFIKFMWG